ncbi:MAG: hypothetical protein WDN28_31380 [Chthoniobacter sp.]
MSLRLQMLQIARVAPKVLGDSADLVRAFFTRQFSPEGGATDRDGKPDLYYTIFALAGLQAMQMEKEMEDRKWKMENWLGTLGDGAALDFVHLSALARCWQWLDSKTCRRAARKRCWPGWRRTAPAMVDMMPISVRCAGNAYGCFVALGAYQDLGHALPEPLRMVQCLKFLEPRMAPGPTRAG